MRTTADAAVGAGSAAGAGDQAFASSGFWTSSRAAPDAAGASIARGGARRGPASGGPPRRAGVPSPLLERAGEPFSELPLRPGRIEFVRLAQVDEEWLFRLEDVLALQRRAFVGIELLVELFELLLLRHRRGGGGGPGRGGRP